MNDVTRTKLGDRPEYIDIPPITSEKYAILSSEPNSMLGTEEKYMMKRFEYDQMFSCLSTEERAKNWTMFRDSISKVLNVRREFTSTISTVESFSNHRMTLRAGGQDLRARQLSEIRAICRKLSISTLHDVDKRTVEPEKLQSVKRYV